MVSWDDSKQFREMLLNVKSRHANIINLVLMGMKTLKDEGTISNEEVFEKTTNMFEKTLTICTEIEKKMGISSKVNYFDLPHCMVF